MKVTLFVNKVSVNDIKVKVSLSKFKKGLIQIWVFF
jgi:hypothetical protein